MKRPTDSDLSRLRVPPAPSLRTRLEGLEVLQEVGTRRGVLLFEALHAASLWEQTPPAARPGLKDPQVADAWRAEVLAEGFTDREIEELFLAIARIWDDPQGLQAVADLATPLRRIGHWADAGGYPVTAALFLEKAARLAPNFPMYAFYAGRSARVAGFMSEAEAWYRYGLSTARQYKEGEAAAYNLIGLGTVARLRGAYPSANRYFTAAYRAARRARARNLAAGALHDLMLVAVYRREFGRAETLAAAASKAYPVEHPSQLHLAHDVALIWIRLGRFELAAKVLEAALTLKLDPQRTVRYTANLARATGGAGNRAGFEPAWARVVCAHEAHASDPAWGVVLGQGLVDLAEGAWALGDRGRVQWAAERALPIVRAQQLNHSEDEIRSLLERASSSQPTSAVPFPETAGEPSAQTLSLADRVGRAVATHRAREESANSTAVA